MYVSFIFFFYYDFDSVGDKIVLIILIFEFLGEFYE